ncbi:MAG: fused MFS/spermidine synthase [Alteromonadaceae bacterium]|nr:fused MFS/spermidine synthase [Alteromonadaceae bacterium]
MGGKEQIARSYYRQNTGVAIALEQLGATGAIKAGFIGLGAGTLAVYGRTGDNYTFYELNPDVERFARSHFSYLAQSKANIEVVLGDARVTLTREFKQQGSQAYQLLVVDAFSGDSIPAHLLTKEAFALYWQYLKEDGVLAIHISNSHLDLTPLVRGLADTFDKQALYFKTLAEQQGGHNAEWVLVTNNKRLLANAKVKRFASKWSAGSENKIVWTDNYSNLLSVLK